MNPELIKLAREFFAAKRRAEKDGMPVTIEEQEEFVAVKSGGKYSLGELQVVMSRTAPTGVSGNVRGIMTRAIQGLTGEFGDEIVGKMPRALGGGEAAAEEMRLADDQYRAHRPVVSAATSMASGFLVPGMGAAKVLPALARGGRGALAAGGVAGATGAVMGGITGAGAAESGQRLEGAARGAAIGTVFGAPLGAAGARISRGSAPAIPGKLREAIRRDTPEIEANLAEAQATGRGDVVGLANLSARMHGMADLFATRSVEAKSRIANLVGRQAAEANARVARWIPDLPAPPARLRQLKDDLKRWSKSDEGFDGLKRQNPQVDATKIIPLLSDPKFVDLLKEANEVHLIGRIPDLGRPSFSILQTVKVKLDAAARAGFKQPQTQELAARIAETRDALVAAMTEAVPGYAPIAAEYGRRLGLQTAIKQGQKAWKSGTVEDIEEIMRDLSPEQITEFRTGMAHGLRSLVQRTKPDRKLATKIVGPQGGGAEPLLQRKLEIVFGDQDNFAEFMRGTRVERDIGDLSKTVTGSQTAERQGQAARSAAVSFSQNPVRAMWQSTVGRVADNIEQRSARQGARVLESQGSKLEEVLRLINRRDLLPMAGAVAGSQAQSLFDR